MGGWVEERRVEQKDGKKRRGEERGRSRPILRAPLVICNLCFALIDATCCVRKRGLL
jgi:hypothetical protein